MDSFINLKESCKMMVNKLDKANSQILTDFEIVGMGSIKTLNVGSTFQMLVPTKENKAKIFSTLLIDDVIIISSSVFHLLVDDGTLFRIEILDKTPQHFN